MTFEAWHLTITCLQFISHSFPILFQMEKNQKRSTQYTLRPEAKKAKGHYEDENDTPIERGGFSQNYINHHTVNEEEVPPPGTQQKDTPKMIHIESSDSSASTTPPQTAEEQAANVLIELIASSSQYVPLSTFPAVSDLRTREQSSPTREDQPTQNDHVSSAFVLHLNL